MANLHPSRWWLEQQLMNYTCSQPYTKTFRLMALNLLYEKRPSCFNRKEFNPGHFVGSAWVVNPARSKVLLMHHLKLEKWLQMGGHSDDNPRTDHVALEEAHEESGIAKSHFRLLQPGIFDLDIHQYKETNTPKNGFEPEHLHYDVCFLFELDDTIPVPGNSESKAIGWQSLDEAAAHQTIGGSFWRRLEKTRQL